MIEFLLVSLGAMITFFFGQTPKVGPIRASATSSLIFYAILTLITKNSGVDYSTWPALFFGGTFIGMSGVERMKWILLPISCVIFTLLFVYVVPSMKGLGGGLGLCAFLSVLPLNIPVKKILIKLKRF